MSLIPRAVNIISMKSGVSVVFKLMAKAVALIFPNSDVIELMKRLHVEARIEQDLIYKCLASLEEMVQSLRYLEGFGNLSTFNY